MTANELHQLNQGLIEISMEDVYNPPIATRILLIPTWLPLVNNHRKGKSFWHSTQGTPFSRYRISHVRIRSCSPFLPFVKFQNLWCSVNTWSIPLYNRLTQKAIVNGQSEGAIKECKEYASAVADQMKAWIKKTITKM